MISYQEFEEIIFNFLIDKNNLDPTFTFSLRQKANKGSEKDYFIGTEKSKYIATTFWNIPVSYPGSATDMINLLFTISDKGVDYKFQFTHTKNPVDDQNQFALNFIQALKPQILNKYKGCKVSADESKTEWYYFESNNGQYQDVQLMLKDVTTTIDELIPIVDKQIQLSKQIDKEFVAERISETSFKSMIDKLDKRLKNGNVTIKVNSEPVSNSVLMPNVKPLNQILYGPPGTGKTYHTINKAISIIENIKEDVLAKEKRNALKLRFEEYNASGQIVFTTFHQSMCYEDFIEGIKPLKPLPDDEFVKYDVQAGIFKNICQEAKSNFENAKTENVSKLSFELAFEMLKEEWDNDSGLKFPLKTSGYDYTILGFTNTSIQFKKASGGTSHTLSISTLRDLYYGKEYDFKQGVGIYYPALINKLNTYQSIEKSPTQIKPFVLIIDEINRGNISQIFGELITLIEESKRIGNEEVLEVTLPYSKEKFSVPPNLYIIGTMNTADRSVEALDTALRRRFSFEEMLPKVEVVKEKSFDDFDRVKIMEIINNRIEILLDRNHTLGHAYFIKKDFKTSFQNEIIPLLQEYFYNDYSKIGLVLGIQSIYFSRL